MTATCTCPTCGQPMREPRVPVEQLLDRDFGSSKQRIMAALVESYPRPVSRDRLINDLYGDDPNGGPDDPGQVISALVCQLRKSLAPMGWTIPRQPTGPSTVHFRRLAPLEA